MPKREGIDDVGTSKFEQRRTLRCVAHFLHTGLLRAPVQIRARPSSANSHRNGGSHNETGLTNFASVSSASLPSFHHTNASGNLVGITHGTVLSPNPQHEGVTDVPFLATAESHLGRMTLTAPDNMRRRKREEKERRRKARKRKGEQAESAALALAAATREPGFGVMSTNPLPYMPTVSTSALSTSSHARSPRRPGISTSRSTSSVAVDSVPSPNDTHHHARPRSRSSQRQQHSQRMSRSDSSPERRVELSEVHRRGTRPNNHTQAPRPRSANSALTSSEAQRTPSQRNETGVRAEALRRATSRRRDIYADLPLLGLPGASDSDHEERPPPPFPEYACRPLSPPELPADGQAWTEELRRRQEEYLMNRLPDSPPPAFNSEEEASSSENETNTDTATAARRMWEADVAAGLPFEERMERDRQRREEAHLSTLSSTGSLANVSLGELVTTARTRRSNLDEGNSVRDSQEQSVQDTTTPSPVGRSRHIHRRTASEGQESKKSTAANVASRHTNAAIGTGRGLVDKSNAKMDHSNRTKPTKIRLRPTSEGHQRFRDDASEAANRRRALWSNSIRDSSRVNESAISSLLTPVPLLRQEAVSDTLTAPVRAESNAQSLLQRQQQRPDSRNESGQEESSDSDEAWERERERFEAMQTSVATAPSSSSDNSSSEHISPVPGAFPQLVELGKVGASIPRAPPPLVLGRSRGGLAYSSSSDSSSEEDVRRPIDEDEDDSESPIAVEESSDDSASSRSHRDAARRNKGKQPVHSAPLLSHDTPSASSDNLSYQSQRAGRFSEDSASSGQISDVEEEEDREKTLLTQSRPLVSHRLKDLFAHQVSGELSKESESSQNPPHLSALDSPAPNIVSHPTEPVSVKNDVPSSFNQSEDRTLRQDVSHTSTNEAKARAEALQKLSEIQRASEPLPPGVDRDSLAALERLLIRSGGESSSGSTPLSEEPSKLTRSGAINSRPFVNPRSSIAPRPLGRLPTITDATRHFPPSQQSASQIRPTRPAPIGTPSWMAYIPSSERKNLPDPLKPVRKSIADAQREPNLPPSPVPSHPSGSRVSAMVNRFENRGMSRESVNQQEITTRGDTSGTFAASGNTALPLNHMNRIRRRPPPPPPSLFSSVSHRSLGHDARVDVEDPASSSNVQPDATSRIHNSSHIQRGTNCSVEPTMHIGKLPSRKTSSSSSSSRGSLVRASEDIAPSQVQNGGMVRDEVLSRPLPKPPTMTHHEEAPSNLASLSNHASPGADSVQCPPHPPSPSFSIEEISQRQGTLSQESSSPQPVQHDPDPPENVRHQEQQQPDLPRREPSLGITDLDVFASQLAHHRTEAEGSSSTTQRDQYDDLHLLAEFLGPAKMPGLTPAEMESLPVAPVEVARRRVVGKRDDGRDKVKLSLTVAGVKVERCAVCMLQFKQGNLACVFPCLHV